MSDNTLIDALVGALARLPGVGPRSAQRMAYHLLIGDRSRGTHLADCLHRAMKEVIHCKCCHTLSTQDTCSICRDSRRLSNQLCIVEMPTDVLALEQSGAYKGRYFVLMGHLSPLDGIGPDKLNIDKLLSLFPGDIDEVIFAINPTIEGEATVHYLRSQLAPFELRLTQLASGVPVGGELEYLNANTIGQALLKREQLEEQN
jgi:recombination protein RecR